MCRFLVTAYVCEHDIVHDTKLCQTKLKAGPFPQVLPCETTEVVRRVDGNCLACEAHDKAKAKAERIHRAAIAGKNASPSWIKKVVHLPGKLLGEYPGAFVPVAAAVHPVTSAPPVVKYGTKVPNYSRPGPPNVARWGHRKPLKATALLGPKAIPSIIIKEADETELEVKSENSWNTGDDLLWQQEPSQVEKPVIIISPPAVMSLPNSQLDTLPSQVHPLRQNPPEIRIQRASTRQRLPHPQPPVISEIEGQTGRKPATATASQLKLARKPLPPRPEEKYATELAADNIYPLVYPTPKGSTHTQPLPSSAMPKNYATELPGNRAYPTPKGSIRMQALPASVFTHWSDQKGLKQPPLATQPMSLATEIDGQPLEVKVNRHSRTEEQAAELFLGGDYTAGQYDPKTLAALHGGPSKEVARTPTVLRAGERKSYAHCYDYEQAAELFFDDGTTLAAQQAGHRHSHQSSKEVPAAVARTPTVLRPAPGRPDSTYIVPNVGQIPTHFTTTTTAIPNPKTLHRHAKLSPQESDTWGAFMSTYPTTPEIAPKLPAFDFDLGEKGMGKAKSREEIRMSSRISRPGLHDFYSRDAGKKTLVPELPAVYTKKVWGGKRGKVPELPVSSAKAGNGEKSMHSQQGQVPRKRLQKARNGEPDPTCVWDRQVLEVCASLETISTTRSYARKAV